MAPLVPASVDLRGLPFMPLDVNRLRDSQLAISASGDEFRAAVLLWCASWNQVPAASLPSDDETLAAYAGYGRDVKSWKKIKSGAMRGFVQCDDGRFYHPVVADKAIEAWTERVEYREQKDNEAERLRRHRAEQKALRVELREKFGIVAPWNEKLESLREMVRREEADGVHVGSDETEAYDGQQRNSTPPETRTGPLHATDKTGTGTGTGKGQGLVEEQQPPVVPDGDALTDAVLKSYHELLPNCQHVSARTPKRLKRIQLADKMARRFCRQQGWPYDTQDFFNSYFGECADDAWLRGDVPHKDNPRWKQNLDVLLHEDRFAGIMDRAISKMRKEQAT